ncbi:beta-aspartyl-peptidase [Brevibacillus ruminantium]|uniref:Isoaspartyl dipeptidase n=1 Tax=Brevibacillus ruminantium TaxID=2950604 RepID=A0ABY4WN25_9BACL|nr:beta-aspartyl-peptidase [Brevibacillus ruminantium]USG68259.1 beta-aspartyl-peptidase [Brevibacillus ruminantium]
MVTLIKNGTVYSPEYMGEQDILIIGNKIAEVKKEIGSCSIFSAIEVIDATGKLVVPGFIDQHVHLIGGGGETGFNSRTPELALSKIIEAGVTTVVGLLGTDGFARHIESLYAKSKGLEKEGLTTFMHTGSYTIPSTTITGSVDRDILFIDKVIGVKVAISDHRSSHCTGEELTRLASQARVAGMLSDKPGMVHVHIGRGKDQLNMILDIVENTNIPITQFVPTHVTRTRELFEQAKQFVRLGGRIDITTYSEFTSTNDLKPSKAVMECIKEGLPIESITVSSDGNGSIPKYDSTGKIVGMGVGNLNASHLFLKNLVQEEGADLSVALKFLTVNVAKVLDIFPEKGKLQAGSDGDLLILNKELNIDTVYAMGKKMMEHGEVMVKGTFED